MKASPMTSSHQQFEHRYRRAKRWNYILGAAALFLAVVLAAQLLPGQSPISAAEDTADRASTVEEGGYQEMEFVRRDADDPTAIGEVDATVVLTMWTDMRCPYCALFSRETLPSIIEEYVEDGRVRIEIHEVSFFGEESENAAIAAQAAANQGRYVEFITTVYDAAPEQGHADLPRERLIEFAEAAGVADIERFADELDDAALREEVQANTRYAQQIGVTSVPFFVAGNDAVAGAQPAANFRLFLDQTLTLAESSE